MSSQKTRSVQAIQKLVPRDEFAVSGGLGSFGPVGVAPAAWGPSGTQLVVAIKGCGNHGGASFGWDIETGKSW